MKRLLPVLLLMLAPLAAKAETVDLGTHGTFSINVPTGWKFSAQKVQDTGYTLTFTAPGEVNGTMLMTLLYVPAPEPVTKERVQDEVLAAGDQFVDSSVEKKKTLRDFNVAGAISAYCVFTDASLVGKPPEKGNFKAVAEGIVQFGDDIAIATTLLFDDEKGPVFATMLATVKSASVSRPK